MSLPLVYILKGGCMDNPIIKSFTDWLDYQELDYAIEDNCVRILYPDGWYIRVSGFDHPNWYIRDMGEVYEMNPFKLQDRILEQALWSEIDAKYGGKDGRELEDN